MNVIIFSIMVGRFFHRGLRRGSFTCYFFVHTYAYSIKQVSTKHPDYADDYAL